MTIKDDFDIEATKATLTRVRDENRALALEEKKLHAECKINTTRAAYNYASKAVAADFLLKACEKGAEAYDQVLNITYKWCYGTIGTHALTKLGRDKRKSYVLPEDLQQLFDAALNDEANVMVTLPTKAQTHIENLDAHNAITRGRIPIVSSIRDHVTGDSTRRRSVPEIIRQIAAIVGGHGINTDSHAHGFSYGM